MKHKNFKIIGGKNLAKEVVDQLLSAIRNKIYKPGDKLPNELELSKIFKVSRGTIREALKNLENIGLLKIKQGSGTFINDEEFKIDFLIKKVAPYIIIKREDILKLMDIRIILESYGVEQAAKYATENELIEMKKVLTIMKNNINNSNKYVKNDLKFHLLIHKSSKNKFLSEILNFIREVYLKQAKIAFDKKDSLTKSTKLHQEIIEAIENKNGPQARKIMKEHLEDVKLTIKDVLHLFPS